MKLFRTTDFAYHGVSVVFWQADAQDQPAIVTETYDKAFTAANMAKEQAFYDRDLKFRVRVRVPALAGEAPAEPVETGSSGTAPVATRRSLECGGSTPLSECAEHNVQTLPLWTAVARTPTAAATPLSDCAERTVPAPRPAKAVSSHSTPKRLRRSEPAAPEGGTLTTECEVTFTPRPQDRFPKVFAKALKAAGLDPAADGAVLSVEWTHRHYVKDDEYIPYGDDIPAFLEREIAKPIVRWEDSPQLGDEIATPAVLLPLVRHCADRKQELFLCATHQGHFSSPEAGRLPGAGA